MAIDFDALRAKRRADVDRVLREIRDGEAGWRPQCSHDEACYCDCPGGPCEHEFSGWREFSDGMGGESFCQKCGMGAMVHTLTRGVL